LEVKGVTSSATLLARLGDASSAKPARVF